MRWPHHSCREMHQSLQKGVGVSQAGEGGALARALPGLSPNPLHHVEGPTHRMLSIQACHVR